MKCTRHSESYFEPSAVRAGICVAPQIQTWVTPFHRPLGTGNENFVRSRIHLEVAIQRFALHVNVVPFILDPGMTMKCFQFGIFAEFCQKVYCTYILLTLWILSAIPEQASESCVIGDQVPIANTFSCWVIYDCQTDYKLYKIIWLPNSTPKQWQSCTKFLTFMNLDDSPCAKFAWCLICHNLEVAGFKFHKLTKGVVQGPHKLWRTLIKEEKLASGCLDILKHAKHLPNEPLTSNMQR